MITGDGMWGCLLSFLPHHPALILTQRGKIKGHRDWRKAMDVKVQKVVARLGAGLSLPGYAVICNSQMREWYRSKEEALRMADIIKDDASNPEDY